MPHKSCEEGARVRTEEVAAIVKQKVSMNKAVNAKQVIRRDRLATADVGGQGEVGVEPDSVAPAKDSRMQYYNH